MAIFFALNFLIISLWEQADFVANFRKPHVSIVLTQ